jgi:hypothetical protein
MAIPLDPNAADTEAKQAQYIVTAKRADHRARAAARARRATRSDYLAATPDAREQMLRLAEHDITQQR